MTNILETITSPVFLSEASPEIVKAVQEALGVQADGICEIKTLTAFYDFKAKNHLAEPNILGATTAKKLLAFKIKRMKTSQVGLRLICEFEGLKLESYKCPAGVWTVG